MSCPVDQNITYSILATVAYCRNPVTLTELERYIVSITGCTIDTPIEPSILINKHENLYGRCRYYTASEYLWILSYLILLGLLHVDDDNCISLVSHASYVRFLDSTYSFNRLHKAWEQYLVAKKWCEEKSSEMGRAVEN